MKTHKIVDYGKAVGIDDTRELAYLVACLKDKYVPNASYTWKKVTCLKCLKKRKIGGL